MAKDHWDCLRHDNAPACPSMVKIWRDFGRTLVLIFQLGYLFVHIQKTIQSSPIKNLLRYKVGGESIFSYYFFSVTFTENFSGAFTNCVSVINFSI